MTRFKYGFLILTILLIGVKVYVFATRKSRRPVPQPLVETIRPLSGPGFAEQTQTYTPAANTGATMNRIKLLGYADMTDEAMALKKLESFFVKRSMAPNIVISWQAVMPDRKVFNRSLTYDRGKERAVYINGSGPPAYFEGLTYQKIRMIAAAPRSTIRENLKSFRVPAARR